MSINTAQRDVPLWSRLVPVFLAVLLGTGGFAVLVPATPVLLEAAGSPLLFGMTQSAVSLCSLLASALLGWYSDLHGRRAAWIVFVTLVVCGSVPPLLGVVGLNRIGLILRMSPGVTKTLGSATVADSIAHDQKAQARANSLMAACFAAGFSLGAPLGGRLSRHGTTSCAAAAFFISVVQAFVVVLCFPRGGEAVSPNQLTVQHIGVNAPSERGRDSSHKKTSEEGPARALLQLWREGDVLVRVILSARSCLGFARMLIISTFQLLTQQRFGSTPEEFGYFLSAVGGCFLLVNALVVPQVFRLPGVPQHGFFVAGCILLCLARVSIAAAPSLALVVAAELVLALGDGLVSSSGTTLLSDLVPASQRGLVIGAGGSIETAAGVLAPAVSGWLFQNIGDFAPAAVSGVTCAMAAVVMLSASTSFAAATPKKKTL
mmetsp:Transcript_112654/g.318253  ORF Transcript_112654/g.318253 Transcript_112654/m.318253 type:complete len:432 (+) Transcript_112654:85-1380(+)